MNSRALGQAARFAFSLSLTYRHYFRSPKAVYYLLIIKLICTPPRSYSSIPARTGI